MIFLTCVGNRRSYALLKGVQGLNECWELEAGGRFSQFYILMEERSTQI